jgi:hypothetical protein
MTTQKIKIKDEGRKFANEKYLKFFPARQSRVLSG